MVAVKFKAEKQRTGAQAKLETIKNREKGKTLKKINDTAEPYDWRVFIFQVYKYGLYSYPTMRGCLSSRYTVMTYIVMAYD